MSYQVIKDGKVINTHDNAAGAEIFMKLASIASPLDALNMSIKKVGE